MKVICFIFCLLALGAHAQQDSIALEEVRVSDYQLRKFSTAQKVISVSDSVARQSGSFLSDVLSDNSPIVVRQNGYGMVSSVSFRGTTAQQTAVVWNGININSQFNGQTDFNAISPADYQMVSVRAGGGGVIYGSSAIGGSVHLQNDVVFTPSFGADIFTRQGSFSTTENHLRIAAASEKFAVNASASYNSSSNDYPLPNGRRNRNGAYRNGGLNLAAGYRTDFGTIRYYSRFYEGKRNFSLIDPNETPTRYENRNTAQILELTNTSTKLTSRSRAAHVFEEYRFFASPSDVNPDYGEASTFIGRQDFTYQPLPKMMLNLTGEYNATHGRGSDIRKAVREITSVAFLAKHQIRQLSWEAGIRKEITSAYESPLLFSGGVQYAPLKWLKYRAAASKNFRMPSFNDLYWSEGGSGGLKPESSIQFEVGQDIFLGKTVLSITGYHLRINDMIQWLPGTSAIWNPQNVRTVNSTGVEISGQSSFVVGQSKFTLTAMYAYTKSENAESKKQLIYVPYHRANGSASWTYRRFSITTQLLFTGQVFTRSDNNPAYTLDPYFVANGSAAVRISDALNIGARIANFADEDYETTIGRPMPGRNYHFFLNLKI